MDTKLRKNKQIRAIIYRAISFGLLIMTMMSLTTGYKAINEVFVNEHYQVLWGDITGVTEFQEYIGKVYNDGMMAFCGVGDDRGYPLEDNGSSSIRDQATIDFYNAVGENHGALLYYVFDYDYEEKEGEYGNELHTNFANPIFSEYDGHLILPEGVRLMYHQDGPEHTLTSNSYLHKDYIKYSYMPNAAKAQELDFVLAVREEGLAEGTGKLAEFTDIAVMYRDQLRFTGVCMVLLVISWIFCIATSKVGRTAKKNMTQVTGRILLEVKILLSALIFIAAWEYIAHPFTAIGERALLKVGFLAICGYFIFLDVRMNGSKVFESFVPVLIYRGIKGWGEKQPWKQRLAVYAGATGVGALFCVAIDWILVCTLWDSLKKVETKKAMMALFNMTKEPLGDGYVRLLVIFWIALVGIALLAICLYNGIRFVKEVGVITDKITDIRCGNLREQLAVTPGAYLSQTADDVNQLESGIENAVEQKSKADRMKVELITNVSHDLKTPLTSIINYVDLLSEEQMSPAARDYVTALQDKAYKLKAMVQDVFDVSKASSGNMHVEKVVLDFGKLIRQTLADMDERIAESSLTFKVNLPEEPVYIEGDGEKLYRIFQNLFVNAIQYSLDYSRVHVGLTLQEGIAKATVKNTSRGELNFDTAEIMERFVRADASRTTEGSGLGLSIAKSFAEACGGEFSIEVDADMFTAIVRFPVVDKPILPIEPDDFPLDPYKQELSREDSSLNDSHI